MCVTTQYSSGFGVIAQKHDPIDSPIVKFFYAMPAMSAHIQFNIADVYWTRKNREIARKSRN